MFITQRFVSLRSFIVLALGLILSVAAYGFAADNTVGGSSAGDGVGAVSGYNVSVVSYALNATDPSSIDGVTVSMTLAAGQVAPKTVAVQFQDTSTTPATVLGGWYTCTGTGPYTCTASGVKATVKPTAQLRVVAAQ